MLANATELGMYTHPCVAIFVDLVESTLAFRRNTIDFSSPSSLQHTLGDMVVKGALDKTNGKSLGNA